MAPVPLPQQQQPSTLSKSPTAASPIAPSPPTSRDALLTAVLPPHLPAPPQQQRALLTPRSIFTSTISTLHQPLSSPSPPHRHIPHAPFCTSNLLLLIPLLILILIFILLVLLELRFLEAHASLFDRLDTWFRRFHKGTSRFRHKPPQAVPPASEREDIEPKNRKTRRTRRGIIAPGFAVKTLLLSVRDNSTRVIRRIIEGREGRDIAVRSFDGVPITPVATRPWELHPSHITAAPMQPQWMDGAEASRIAYGVPPPPKLSRARRSTIALNALELEAAVEGEVISVLRQQAIADEEASAAADPLMMGTPRGQCGGEERDLEALEGRSVNVGLRGGEGLVVRRGWNGGGGADDGDEGIV